MKSLIKNFGLFNIVNILNTVSGFHRDGHISLSLFALMPLTREWATQCPERFPSSCVILMLAGGGGYLMFKWLD